jgi:hypothetical protein
MAQVTVDLEKLYTLYFRTRENPHPEFIVFRCDAGWRPAVLKAKLYCENSNKRFVTVRPFFVDIDKPVVPTLEESANVGVIADPGRPKEQPKP